MVIFIALAMIVATLLGFSTHVVKFLENVATTRYLSTANSNAYIRMLSVGLFILAVPVIFHVAIRFLGLLESRREKIEREKGAVQNLN